MNRKESNAVRLIGGDWFRPDTYRDGGTPRTPDGLVNPGQTKVLNNFSAFDFVMAA